ncbi:MAG: hypothetical protein KJO26_15120 [Deltaproteobacteria bacterium]|nr:hypothetical protein [Deltaproteobacteria bacterium]NNK86524.1 hypothetical protein [Desulfobacterales bacterium]
MLKRIKSYIFIGIFLALGYFISSYHIIFYKLNNNLDVKLLKKSYLTLEYTFFNVTTKRGADVMKIDLLRWAEIGDLLVEIGKLTEGERQALEAKYENEGY